jgi:hypothetical protein
MIEELAGMPDGTFGFRIWGKVSKGDYEAILPRIEELVESGDELRFLSQIGPDFEGMTAGALWEDIKEDVRFELFGRAKWKRIAVVTDVEWIQRAFNLMGWIAPGELKLFGLEEFEAAKAWMTA